MKERLDKPIVEEGGRSANESPKRRVACLMNSTKVINPDEYSALQIIGSALLNSGYNPFGIANLIEEVMDDQIPTYNNIK